MSPWSSSMSYSSLPPVEDDRSNLLSESLPSHDPTEASPQDTGPGGTDLSLSELSLSDRPFTRDSPRFSLLAPQFVPSQPFSSDQSVVAEGQETTNASPDAEEEGADTTIMERVPSAHARDEKLQHDLFILRKLNASFAVLNNALGTTKSVTEQVAEQLVQTDALLDKYANMLSKSEGVTRLIFDERWGGAEADEEAVAQEHAQALERQRLERERQEAARREEEERARREAEVARREAEERAQKEAAMAAQTKIGSRGRGATTGTRSGVRGVRGTRASAAAMAARSGSGAGGRVVSSGVGASTAVHTHSASVAGGIPRPNSVARGSQSGVPRGIPRRG
ncbi:hypothetical protein ID866_4424 [Astraeus odoratus]|nr:hypothetical protein ID866_4424 [Astraeus odoratus]